MCGIGGFVDYERDARRGGPILHGMKRTLTPRGPDAEGTYFDEDTALIHRRLIVIDPEGGKQPMCSPDRNTILIYNGELYNTPELRTELMSRGHEFVGHSDTEVLLHAYLEWKTDAFARLNGIFAFAIWEKRERRLTLCRDRLGVKPLFFAPIRNGLTFGSTIDTVLCHPEIEPALDEDGLRTLLLLGPARPPESGVFRQISSLMPGHFAVLTPEAFTDHTYWKLEAHEHEDDLPTTVERTHTLICDAARRQLVSDVPLACFLSGGLDSSILSMLAAKDYAARGETLHTWSVDYRDNDKYFTKSIFQPNSDDSYIDQMVDFLSTHHHRVVLEPEALCAALLPATDARALPGMADVDSSLLLFCAAVKRGGTTVCLSGECADELFGGYPWYHREEILFEDTFPWSRSVGLRLGLLTPDAVRNGEEFVHQHYRDTCARAPRLPSDDKKAARMREMFVLNLDWFMATLLDRKDRMSMYSGLEVRVPFCDHRIVEYAYNMPWDFKSLEGREKGIVRRAFADELPKEIVYRKKSPYPKTFHPVYTRLCADYVRRIFEDNTSVAASLFDRNAVQKLMQRPESLAEPWFGQLMRTPQIFAYIIQLDRWFRHYHVKIV
ncbi:asparagine synthase (glutamine-hydrolyzing) [Butyricicoccus sp. TM10-16AC]|jgi:asparagine synthase (glutamine-hydrolysing)|uniref:asparagine synthase (glutamine-hydrolyzing) n=1 Tax=Butyricicoccus sp. AF35-5AC TaxID=2292003 RepID=UPI000E4B0619|nr:MULTISPECIES: asparagine synthase (glutamine-hydrolyzing) [unclassified Butyricicoccus]RHP11945.1 asparagine synthase (glutamine-hydrolyzing) [Butyricicoccus sp. AF35-5AC]RHU17905.1 asparagine synthase (glutamine-hydrolyzing) [Butyricicoccus sp. TM10-16AC]